MQIFRKIWLNFLYKLSAKNKIKFSMSIGQRAKIFILISIISLILIISLFFLFSNKSQITNPAGIEYAKKNYLKEVKKYAKKYKISSAYLMSLIMLESSGRKNIKPRFEKHIYYQLLRLRDGRINHFEDLVPSDLKGFSNEKIRQLAKSYGPFQIMGYKTIKMKISINELKGRSAIKYGTYWINKNYGYLLRQGKFMDAFHMHNTGRVYPQSGKPKTHNPKYVQYGMEYLRYFSRNE